MKIEEEQIFSKTVNLGNNELVFNDEQLDKIYKKYGSSNELTATFILTTKNKYTDTKTCKIILNRKSKNRTCRSKWNSKKSKNLHKKKWKNKTSSNLGWK